jgi:phage I-like protein
MAATISEGLATLNNADLSKLLQRIKDIRSLAEKELNVQGKSAGTVATSADIAAAAGQAGVSVEEFMELLESAKRRGLI